MGKILLVVLVIVCLVFTYGGYSVKALSQEPSGQSRSNLVDSFTLERIDTVLYFHWFVNNPFDSSKYIIQEIFQATHDTIEISSDYGFSHHDELLEYYYVDQSPKEVMPDVRLKILTVDNKAEYITPVLQGF